MADLFKDILATIDSKSYNYFDENDSDEEIKTYVPFVVNKNYSFGMDSLLYANEINKYHELDNKMQYDFYYYALDKKKRFNGRYWKIKKDKSDDIAINAISKLLEIPTSKAQQYLEFYSAEEIKTIIDTMEKYKDD